jgi:hypothetical protein
VTNAPQRRRRNLAKLRRKQEQKDASIAGKTKRRKKATGG